MSSDTRSAPYEAKADFSAIYDQPDPRSYYRTLGAFDYEIPAHGTAVFEHLLEEMGGREGKRVLDLCCGYGVNATLLNHRVALDELYEHYEGATAADPADLVERDRQFFSARRRPDAVSTVGLDVAGNAVRYAASAGLLDHGVVADLETHPEPGEALAGLGPVDLVTVTGGIGYIGERTFRAVVEAAGDQQPWIAALNLRWIDFRPIAEALSDLGLVTEQVDGYCVPQRRFADEREREAALAGLSSRGIDPAEELRAESHCAELLVVRPPEAVRDVPIDDVFASFTAD
jgi:hypothetical protein